MVTRKQHLKNVHGKKLTEVHKHIVITCPSIECKNILFSYLILSSYIKTIYLMDLINI